MSEAYDEGGLKLTAHLCGKAEEVFENAAV
jgi:hypothetical protein